MCFLVELFFLVDFYIKPPLVISIEEWDFEIGNSLTDFILTVLGNIRKYEDSKIEHKILCTYRKCRIIVDSRGGSSPFFLARAEPSQKNFEPSEPRAW